MDFVTMITENYLGVILAALIAQVGILEAIPKAWKPVRSFVGLFTKRSKDEQKLINEKLDGIIGSIGEIKQDMSRYDSRIDTLQHQIDVLQRQISENEKDRLKRIIFQFGNYARKGDRISGEEFRYLQEVWRKYSEVLHGNDIAHDEYEMVCEYYNGQYRRAKDENQLGSQN